MRLAAYAGASTVLAAGVVLKAFHERPNFYSASVYLSQSSACRMILLNLLLLITYGLMRGLQKIVYGPLRAIEREQLWDKAWYAVTETALAMTTFRDEVGTWFFVMFVSLLAGKVWQWISEARVEALEQQPPANPGLFHARLVISLAISELFDVLMLRYCVNTLLEQPRPGMMVMFAFEFAVLAVSSTSTTSKYILSLIEAQVIKQQTKLRVQERREELRLEREENRRRAGEDAAAVNEPEEEVDEESIDVPGWQEKGRWMLFLDLLTDLFKLVIYMCFFSILIMFHGIPIHIIRDVFLTARSFVKRITDFLKYRNATRDMNARYPDATAEELERDRTCIICREEMQAWQPEGAAGGQRRGTRTIVDERQRPKKLPCGHVLHFGCLRSWLERQQVCPTCRSSVLAPSRGQSNTNQNNQQPGQPGYRPGDGPDGAHQPGGANANGAARPRPGLRARTFRLAGMRFTFAAGNEQQVQEALGVGGNNQNTTATRLNNLREAAEGIRSHSSSIQDNFARIERQLMREINSLNASQEQLAYTRALQGELERLRTAQANPGSSATAVPAMSIPPVLPQFQFNGMAAAPGFRATPTPSNMGYAAGQQIPYMASGQPQLLTSALTPTVLGPGHHDLPAGLTLPEGWNMLPLQRVNRMSQTSNPTRTTAQNLPADAVLLQTPLTSYNAAANAAAQTRTRPASTHEPNSHAPRTGLNPQPSVPSSATQTAPAPQTPLSQPRPAGNLDFTVTAPPEWITSTTEPAMPSSDIEPAAVEASAANHDEDNGIVTGLPNWGSAATSEPSAALPDWAVAAATQASGHSTSATEPASENMNGHHADSSISSQDRKGKGRAATVEDAGDDSGS